LSKNNRRNDEESNEDAQEQRQLSHHFASIARVALEITMPGNQHGNRSRAPHLRRGYQQSVAWRSEDGIRRISRQQQFGVTLSVCPGALTDRPAETRNSRPAQLPVRGSWQRAADETRHVHTFVMAGQGFSEMSADWLCLEGAWI
jgi:hypothetical protein